MEKNALRTKLLNLFTKRTSKSMGKFEFYYDRWMDGAAAALLSVDSVTLSLQQCWSARYVKKLFESILIVVSDSASNFHRVVKVLLQLKFFLLSYDNDNFFNGFPRCGFSACPRHAFVDCQE